MSWHSILRPTSSTAMRPLRRGEPVVAHRRGVREACDLHVDDAPDVGRTKCLAAVSALMGTILQRPAWSTACSRHGLRRTAASARPTRARAEAGQALLAFVEAAVRKRPSSSARRPALGRRARARAHRQLASSWPPTVRADRHGASEPADEVVTQSGAAQRDVLNLDPLDRSAAAICSTSCWPRSCRDAARDAARPQRWQSFYLEESSPCSPRVQPRRRRAGCRAPDTLRVSSRRASTVHDASSNAGGCAVWGRPVHGRLDEIARHSRGNTDVTTRAVAVDKRSSRSTIVSGVPLRPRREVASRG